MTFIDTKLSRRVSVGFTGGPTWNTTVVAMKNGSERRNAEWTMPHHKFTADYTLLDPIAQNEILNAFWAAKGQLDSFAFKDWNDYRAANQALGLGDGTTNARQLTKAYTFGPTTFVRTIVLPIAATLAVTADGDPFAVTVDEETGLVTPGSAWPSGKVLLASFEFDVRVRFAADYIPFNRDSGMTAQATFDLIEALTP